MSVKQPFNNILYRKAFDVSSGLQQIKPHELSLSAAHLSLVSIRVFEGRSPVAVHPWPQHRVTCLCVPFRQPLKRCQALIQCAIMQLPNIWTAQGQKPGPCNNEVICKIKQGNKLMGQHMPWCPVKRHRVEPRFSHQTRQLYAG